MNTDAAASHSRATRDLWIGDLVLELRNGFGWSIGHAELALALDTMSVRILGRELAVILRDDFRNWLQLENPEPYTIDDIVWTSRDRHLFLEFGPSSCTVTAESTDCLRWCV
jgi:hypothetical protein